MKHHRNVYRRAARKCLLARERLHFGFLVDTEKLPRNCSSNAKGAGVDSRLFRTCPYLQEGWSQTGQLREGRITLTRNSSDRGGVFGLLSFINSNSRLSGWLAGCLAPHTRCQTRGTHLTRNTFSSPVETAFEKQLLLFFFCFFTHTLCAQVMKRLSWIGGEKNDNFKEQEGVNLP